MTFHVEAWELLLGICGLIAAMASAAWAFGRVVVGQFAANLDQRFQALNESRRQSNANMERRIDELQSTFETEHNELKASWDERFADVRDMASDNEKALLRLRAELPSDYVRREDWIRFSGTIDAKLDHLRTAVDGVREKINARG